MGKEKIYIGVKILRAFPMPAPEDVKGNNKPGDPGYTVIYDNGYTSWSPKDVFEAHYREITDAEKKVCIK